MLQFLNPTQSIQSVAQGPLKISPAPGGMGMAPPSPPHLTNPKHQLIPKQIGGMPVPPVTSMPVGQPRPFPNPAQTGQQFNFQPPGLGGDLNSILQQAFSAQFGGLR